MRDAPDTGDQAAGAIRDAIEWGHPSDSDRINTAPVVERRWRKDKAGSDRDAWLSEDPLGAQRRDEVVAHAIRGRGPSHHQRV